MKTLILACLSCVILAGVYFTLNNRSKVAKLLAFTQPESTSFTAVPASEQESTETQSNTDVVATLPTVETQPVQNEVIPVINEGNMEVQPEMAVSTPEPSSKPDDSSWFDYSAFQIDAATETSPATQTTEAPVATEKVDTEEENRFVHVPFMEEAEENAADPALDPRRLTMKLNPETTDTVTRFTAPARVMAASIARYAVATDADKMVVAPAAVQTEEKGKVTYAPSHLVATQAEVGRESYSYTVLYDRAEKIKAYAVRKGYDTSYAFMIDMGMKSGRKRFFVMDLNTMTIIKRGMVAHGRGNSSFTFNKTYSNTSGSNCTSLGIYKVGASYKGTYGLSYKLFGLENTNSNAYKRSIVLHGLSCVPYDESEFAISQSEGCPSLSPAFLKEISPIINSRSKPMLMWIYDPLAESLEEGMVSNN